MTLVRWNPVHDLPAGVSDMLGMQRDINRMFDRLFRGGLEEEGNLAASAWSPAVDVAELDDRYEVKLELPGVPKDDVKISLEGDHLTVRGEKRQEKESKGKNYHRVERSYGAFQRSFTLPAHVRSEKVEAAFTDGVLTVTLPKAEEARPKQIDVKVK
jgi:HSP20 family protein